MMLRARGAFIVSGILITMLPAICLAGAEAANTGEEGKPEDLRTYIRANYTKSEYLAPMRDGVRLFISVYAPKDTSRRYPIWMMRTPYTVAPYGVDNYPATLGPSEFFARDGYIFAYCDVRGKRQVRGAIRGRPALHSQQDLAPPD